MTHSDPRNAALSRPVPASELSPIESKIQQLQPADPDEAERVSTLLARAFTLAESCLTAAEEKADALVADAVDSQNLQIEAIETAQAALDRAQADKVVFQEESQAAWRARQILQEARDLAT